MESVDTKFEPKSSVDVLGVGKSLTLEKDVPTLLGRADCGVSGFKVYRIDSLEKNLKVSNFGLELLFDGQKVVFSRPKFVADGQQYIGSNRIRVEDNLHKKFDVDEKYDPELSTGLYRVYVGDEETKNGFILEMVGNNMVRLNAVANKG